MQKVSTKSRTLRLPLSLDNSIQEAAKMGGRSFSDVAIDLLAGNTVIVVEEGAKLAELLVELRSCIKDTSSEDSDKIHNVLEQVTETLYEIVEKYILKGGESHSGSDNV